MLSSEVKPNKMERQMTSITDSERDTILRLLCAESPMREVDITSQLILKNRLANIKTNATDKIPENVVSLGKLISIKMSFGSKSGLKLVLPHEADLESNKFSVLSPLGCAIYGKKAGDIVKWHFDEHVEDVEILSVRGKRTGILSLFL